MQKLLFDRRLVLRLLDAIGVPTPRRLVVDRDSGPILSDDIKQSLNALNISFDYTDTSIHRDVRQIDLDTIEVGGERLTKPFVEKPVSGEDHNIWIYYAQADGGGVRRLFRKIANKSSEFVPDNLPLRSDGAYIYEEFMNVDNAEDVKVYTVGPNKFHAETRK